MKNNSTVLVCVTAQSSSKGLVEAAKALAEKNSAALEVVSVLPIADGERSIDCDSLEKIYAAAKKSGGSMAVYFSEDPVLTVSAHIAKRKPLTVVTGFPGEGSIGFVSGIHLLFPCLPITMVDKDGKIYNMLPAGAVRETEKSGKVI